MAQIVSQSQGSRGQLPGTIRTYNEIVMFLDQLPRRQYEPAVLQRMEQLDKAFNNVASRVKTILIGGTNGKSMAIQCAARLFAEENITVHSAYSSHFLQYNERIVVAGNQILNKEFTDLMNEVIGVMENESIAATATELMMIASLIHAERSEAEVLLVEVGIGGQYDAAAYCTPQMIAITRVAEDATGILHGTDRDENARELSTLARPGVPFISAEQSKLRLQKMKKWVEGLGGEWVMPIRKLAALPYMYEQLYGRTAALGERVVQMYVENIMKKFSPFLRGNLLATKKGQRGRPTLEAKRQAELNPIKTMKTFWLDSFKPLKGRFDLNEAESPRMLVDNGSNSDAFENLFLGIRLLHYQKPIKGLVLILGVAETLALVDLMKSIRYLLKKVPGELFIVPLPDLPGYETEEVAEMAKRLNIAAQACRSLEEAVLIAKERVDGRDGLVVAAGSPGIVRQHWKAMGKKKIS